jgi:hypothetical protein
LNRIQSKSVTSQNKIKRKAGAASREGTEKENLRVTYERQKFEIKMNDEPQILTI